MKKSLKKINKRKQDELKNEDNNANSLQNIDLNKIAVLILIVYNIIYIAILIKIFLKISNL